MKDRPSLSSYARSQKKQIPGLSHPSTSARTMKRGFSNKRLMTGAGGRKILKRKKNSDIQFDKYVSSVSSQRPVTKGSMRGVIASENKRSAKDFKIRKNHILREGKIGAGYDLQSNISRKNTAEKNFENHNVGIKSKLNSNKEIISENQIQDYIQSSEGFKVLK